MQKQSGKQKWIGHKTDCGIGYKLNPNITIFRLVLVLELTSLSFIDRHKSAIRSPLMSTKALEWGVKE